MARQLPEFVAVGIVEKAHGLRGEIKVKALTDSPERFNLLTRVYIEQAGRPAFECQIERVAVRQDRVLLSLVGVDNREKAEQLRAAYLSIRREEVLPLGEDEFYHFEVMGLDVLTRDGRALGTVADVLDLTSNTLLNVRSKTGTQEYLIPVIRDVIDKMDFEAGRIIINPIDGLLD